MTRRNFLSTSAVAAFACGASLTAHAAGSTDENSLNFITDIFKDSPQPGEIEDATAITAEKNAEWYEKLDFSDRREFANAERGWLDNAEGKIIYAEDGKFAWDLQSYGDLNRDAPDTVNPSLWRNTQLNAKAGLFEVCDGIYQVRGFDMANATFIRTNNGWIIFDVLMCKENMQAAKALMENRFGPLDVKAVLYSHSHVDHFGGAEGAIDRNNVADPSLSVDKQLASGKTVILAPKGFLKHAISENVYAGIAMARRAQYQYGTVLEKGEKGALSIGIGMGQSTGHVSLIAPTYEIGEEVPKLTIDGLEIEFQLTPGTEAPAEMNAYFPKYRALWMAENCTGTLHNLYTLRGAEVRDANDWAKYIIEADQRFCSKTDVVFQSHNWPHWGEEIHEYLLNTAAIYKFIHDQTLHYMNQGYTSNEIAAMISLPDFDPNLSGNPDERCQFNFTTKGLYEPGSVFKIFNAALGLESGKIKLSDRFDATKPLKLKYNTIKDYRGENRWLDLQEILIYSSNIGSAQIALKVGQDEQKKFLRKMGLFDPLDSFEVTEKAAPSLPSRWGEATTATVSYGYGVSVTPLTSQRSTYP